MSRVTISNITKILFMCLLTVGTNAYSQSKPAGTLKLGSKLPNLPIGKLLDHNYKLSEDQMGKTNFAQYKGKLVIFDFWGTSCGSCIENFDNLSRIQAEFQDRVKIFLVNPIENEVQIRERMQVLESRMSKKLTPENLSIIADAKSLYQLFPVAAGFSYHIWIDTLGNFTGRGWSENTNSRKIKEYFSGRPITFIRDKNIQIDFARPFFIDAKKLGGGTFNSTVGPFDDAAYSAYGNARESHVDSNSQTIRSTYINLDVNSVLQRALFDRFSEDSIVLFGNRINFSIPDSGRVTQDKTILKRKATDYELRDRICYEQIVPQSVPRSTRMKLMYDDLRRYLLNNLGITANLEVLKTNCYQLVFYGDSTKIKSKRASPDLTYSLLDKTNLRNYQGYNAKALFKSYFRDYSRSGLFAPEVIIVNATGLDCDIDLYLPEPSSVKELTELVKILNAQGFGLVEGSANVEFLRYATVNAE